jgi:hypothetical protein
VATAGETLEISALGFRAPLMRSGRMKLDDEIVELEEWDAVRVPRGAWRG